MIKKVGRYTFKNPIFLLSFLVLNIFLGSCNSESSRTNKQNLKQDSVHQSSNSTVDAGLTAEDLKKASLDGNLNKVKKAVSNNIDVNYADKQGRTSLMLAAYNGHTKVARYLLKNGASISRSDINGRTPLIFAASGPFPDTVELLLKHNADPNTVDNGEGWSPLMFAAAGGHGEVVKILLDGNADIQLKDKDGETALDFARNNNHANIIELLKKGK